MSFWKKLVSVMLCGVILAGYNAVVTARGYEEKISELNAHVSSLQAQVDYDAKLLDSLSDKKDDRSEKSDYTYNDGEYEGSAQGYGGTVTVKVKIEKDVIRNIQVSSAEKEDAAYLNMSMKMISDIKDKQSPEVDTVSGATMTSTGIKNAVMLALNNALK